MSDLEGEDDIGHGVVLHAIHIIPAGESLRTQRILQVLATLCSILDRENEGGRITLVGKLKIEILVGIVIQSVFGSDGGHTNSSGKEQSTLQWEITRSSSISDGSRFVEP